MIGCKVMHTVWWLRIAPGSTQVLPSLWTSMSHSHSQQDLGQRCQQEMFHLRSSAATRVIVSLPGHLIFDRHRDHISFCSSSSLKREPTSSTLLLMLGQECSTTRFPTNQPRLSVVLPRAFRFQIAWRALAEVALAVAFVELLHHMSAWILSSLPFRSPMNCACA